MSNKFLYIADPMCSWCYGFSLELSKLLETLPDAEVDIVLGGLRAYNTEVMDDDTRQMILSHWQKVADVSCLPFDMTGMNKPGFIYNTEPACRAVVTAKLLADDGAPDDLLKVFRAIQHAFYAEAKDVTNEAVLAEVCVNALNQNGAGAYDVESYLETLQSPSTHDETRQHFEQIQRWGIRGFPVLCVVKDNGLHMIASGYTQLENLQQALAELA
jgi:putative protein-disulfide isomerase